MLKAFFKENIELVVALSLPIILIICFAGWQAITITSTPPLQNDFLLLTGYNESNNLYSFTVNNDGALIVTRRYPWKDGNRTYNYYHNNSTKFWRVYAEDMSVEEIPLPKPANSEILDTPKEETITLEATRNLKLSTRVPGPDGYALSNMRNQYRGNFMLELFGHRNRDSVFIEKNGRRISVKGLEGIRTYNTKFVGWIEK